MMPVAKTSTWPLGPYLVVAKPRSDSPAFLVYVIFRGAKLIGKSFSVPDEGCCRWLEHSSGTVYAQTSPQPRRHSANSCGARGGRNGHPKT